ncbi:MAG: PAS domain S-box protein [Proteobacteria bacterium]|nr:PAS domain S-box protein [Pseudomonadota bacterium]
MRPKQPKCAYAVLMAVTGMLLCHFLSMGTVNAETTGADHITAGVLENWPPHYLTDQKTGKPTGMAIDISDEIGRICHITISYRVFKTWPALFQALLDKKIDIVPNMGITEERKKDFLYTIPYETFKIHFFIRKNSTGINTEADLRNRLVSVVKTNQGHSILEQKGWQNLKVYDSLEEALMSLLSGNSDAFAYPDLPLIAMLRQLGLEDNVRIIGEPLAEIKRGIAAHKDNHALIEKLDAAMHALIATHEYERIYVTWYGEKKPFWTAARVAIFMGMGILIVSLILFFWHYVSILNLNKKLISQTRLREESERHLHQMQHKFSAIMDHSPALISIKDTTGVILLANKKFQDLDNPPPEGYLGKGVFDIFPDKTASALGENDRRALETGGPVKTEETVQHKDGTWHTYLTIRFPLYEDDKKPMGVCAISTDITERKQAEKELVRKKEQLEIAVKSGNIGLWDWEFSTHQVWFSKEWKHQIGYAENEISDQFDEWQSRVHPDDIEHTLEIIKKYINNQLPDYQVEFRFRHKDGSYRWIMANGTLMNDPDGKSRRMVGSHIDITELKRAESALRETGELLNETGRIAKIGGWEFDVETLQGTWTDEVARIHDLDPQDPTSVEKGLSFFHGEHRKRLELALKEAMASGTPYDLELEMISAKGKHKWVRTVGIPVQKGNTVIKVRGSFQDITEKKIAEAQNQLLEEKLRQAQKMEAIGTLAGGIAHDFNNILSIVLGNIELALEDVSEDKDAYECMNEARVASLRAKDLVTQILDFSRSSKPQKERLTIAPIVKESVKLLRSTIPRTVDILEDIRLIQDSVIGNATQIYQVILNLCTNASHAMNNEGILRIELQKIFLNENDIPGEDNLKAGDYVKLAVRDTGCGISPQIIPRIFDPYFTTKEIGKGTGMGLSVAHGIVRDHNGFITVESELSQGTTFTVYLPAVETKHDDPEDHQGEIRKGSESILFVDDEDMLVHISKRKLNKLGYTVDSFSDPVAALTAFRKNPDKYDLVITDISMPDLPGHKLAIEILKVRKDMPVILSTGYTELISEKQLAAMQIKKVLRKPFTTYSLCKAIGDALDGQA